MLQFEERTQEVLLLLYEGVGGAQKKRPVVLQCGSREVRDNRS